MFLKIYMDNNIYVFLLSNQHIFIVYPLLTRGYILEQADTHKSLDSWCLYSGSETENKQEETQIWEYLSSVSTGCREGESFPCRGPSWTPPHLTINTDVDTKHVQGQLASLSNLECKKPREHSSQITMKEIVI